MQHVVRRLPSPAMVVALVALFVALGGPATAAHIISGRSIKKNSITNRQIRNHTLGVQELSPRAYDTLRTTPVKSVGPAQVRDGAIRGRALGPKAVDGSKLGDGAVGPVQLASKAVDGTKLADGAVTASKVANGAIGGAAIADGGLQTRDLGDFYGSVSVPFGTFGPDTCKVATVNAQPAMAGASIADDVVAVSPGTSGWPDPIIVTANPGAGNTIRIIACRIGSAPSPDPMATPDRTTFFYVAFDTP